MANSPTDFRDPKVTDTHKSGSNIGKILLWVALAILGLLLLAWLLGLFAADEEVIATVPLEESTSETVVIEEGATTAPAVTAPAITDDTATTTAPVTTAPLDTDGAETEIVPVVPVD